MLKLFRSFLIVSSILCSSVGIANADRVGFCQDVVIQATGDGEFDINDVPNQNCTVTCTADVGQDPLECPSDFTMSDCCSCHYTAGTPVINGTQQRSFFPHEFISFGKSYCHCIATLECKAQSVCTQAAADPVGESVTPPQK